MNTLEVAITSFALDSYNRFEFKFEFEFEFEFE
jgi:hypothetical protein